MRVFALHSIKGGVGKTASAVNLAYLSSLDGSRTLLWDLDPQAAATFYLRLRPKVGARVRRLVGGAVPVSELIRETDYPGLDLIPGDFRYRKLDRALDRVKRPAGRIATLLQPLAEEYDHLFLDCPPNITRLTDAVLVAADVLLVPNIPTTLSLRTLDLLRGHLRERRRKPRVAAFFTMVDRRKRLHRETVEDTVGTDPDFLSVAVPYASEVERMGIHREPLAVTAPWSRAALAYAELWREIRRLSAAPAAPRM